MNTVTNTPGAGVMQNPPGNFGVECVRTLAGARVDQSLANVDQPLANRCLVLSLHAGRTVSQARCLVLSLHAGRTVSQAAAQVFMRFLRFNRSSISLWEPLEIVDTVARLLSSSKFPVPEPKDYISLKKGCTFLPRVTVGVSRNQGKGRT